MGLAVLPLHVWDRELDARILLAALLVSKGHQVLLGHEYNIAPIYKQVPNIYHFGAGRPIYYEPRTNDWYEPIIENNGFVGLVFEEGINDMIVDPFVSYPGINLRSVKSTSKVFAWCDKEIRRMCDACEDPDLSRILLSRSAVTSNVRMELLGDLGSFYFSDYISSLKTIFGDYVLISDNFALEVFGVGGPLKPEDQLRWVSNEAHKSEFLSSISDSYKSSVRRRVEFLNLINSLVKQHPHINFIFRPHPVADPKFWNVNLNSARNLTILSKDNSVPWLKCASAVIHAGCTLGLEAEIANVPSIDISKLCGLTGDTAASHYVSRYRPSSFSELQKAVTELVRSSQAKLPQQTPSSTSGCLKQNLSSLNSSAFKALSSSGIDIPLISCLSVLENSFEEFFSSEKSYSNYHPKAFASSITKLPPLQGKSKYYSVSSISQRLRSAYSALSINTPVTITQYPKSNVFLLSPK